MALPGFSISELIAAAAKTKDVYDSFFGKYENASNRVRNLRDTVDLFRSNLANHQWLLEQSGRTYPGLDAFNRTLVECNEFISKYDRLLDGSKFRPRDAIRNIAWTFEDKYIGTLMRQLQLHIQALNCFTLNLLLKNAVESPASSGHQSPLHSNSYSQTFNINVNMPQTPMLPESKQMQGLGIIEAAPPRLQIESADSANALAGLWQEVQIYSNRQKRVQNRDIQNWRTLQQGNEHQRRHSVQLQAHQELQLVVEKWKAIARANGVDERSLPDIPADQPLETADEFCKRILQASEMASMTTISPLHMPPHLELGVWPDPPHLRPQPPGSERHTSSADSSRTQKTSSTCTPPSLHNLDDPGDPDDIWLPPPNVLEGRVNLSLKNKERQQPYPTLKLKRVEVRQAPGSRDISVVCTMVNNVQLQHKVPHGSRTHPYTKHKMFNKPYEVSFLEHHQIVQGSTTYTGDPTYTFFSDQDCKNFQACIRSKKLIHTWDIEKIAFRTSNAIGEASDQHLKIWKDFVGGALSISFFANNPSDDKGRRHREFPLSRLDLAPPNAKRRAAHTVRLEFNPTRRPSLAGSAAPIFDDLSAVPMGSYPSSVDTSPNPGTSPTARYSSHIGGGPRSPTLEAGPTSPTTPTQTRSHRRRSSAKGGVLSRVPTLQTNGPSTGTSTTLDEIEGRASLGLSSEEANRLRYMDITFTEADDAEKFEKLLPQIQHIA